jgi:hypothetical protein
MYNFQRTVRRSIDAVLLTVLLYCILYCTFRPTELTLALQPLKGLSHNFKVAVGGTGGLDLIRIGTSNSF